MVKMDSTRLKKYFLSIIASNNKNFKMILPSVRRQRISGCSFSEKFLQFKLQHFSI
jgi:hypothetical protein